MNKMPNIAFLGIGLMGLPMASHLVQAGYTLSAWNRTPEKALPLQAQGAHVAREAAGAVDSADIVISIVADGSVVLDLVKQPAVRAALKPGAVWVDMSSTKPEEARQVSEALTLLDVSFVDAPVSGGTKGAAAATLAIMAGGRAEDFEQVKPVLMCLGRPVHVGPVGAGQLSKLANQLIVAATIGAVSEAMLLLEQGGADAAAVRDALKGGFADSTILQQHGERMTHRDFVPGGLSRLQLKDLDNILIEATAHGLQLPVTEQIQARFSRYVNDLGGADKDHAGLFEELLDLNRMK